MRAMEAELGMYKQQVDLFKSDIEAANEGMRNLRHRWVAEQRRGKSNRREGWSDGADETINVTASVEDTPSPVGTVAASSAHTMPSLLLQDRNISAPGLEKAFDHEVERPEGSEAGSPPAAAAP